MRNRYYRSAAASIARSLNCKSRIVFFAVALVISLITIFGLFATDIADYAKINAWPETTATVIRRDVVGYNEYQQIYNVVKYEAQGEKYESTMKFDPIDELAYASHINIRYNPDDPTETAMEPNVVEFKTIVSAFLCGVLAVAFAVNLAKAVAEFKRKKAEREDTMQGYTLN